MTTLIWIGLTVNALGVCLWVIGCIMHLIEPKSKVEFSDVYDGY